jgi:hypothetical protein
MALEGRIHEVLEGIGPVPGKELAEALGEGVFPVWRACTLSRDIVTRVVGKRYLRFDRNVGGYARLSPSIQREFMTYTVVGVKKDLPAIEEKAGELIQEIRAISRAKEAAARKAVQDILSRLGELGKTVEKEACFILGGDVPLGMAHADPRPEKSTGLLVAGSDLDLVVVHRDELQEDGVGRLDEAIYSEKYALLKNPLKKEEIDYIIKPLSRVREQAAFDTFEHMVACKIIMEGSPIAGSGKLYREVLEIMKKNGIKEKLDEMEERARAFREMARAHLLKSRELTDEDYVRYFTTTEEIGEIF